MKIEAITVCVNYADQFCKGIERWKRGLDSLLVVTTPEDTATRRLCDAWDVPTFPTDLFYRDGAIFNKGRALAAAYEATRPADWVLFFDSDIIPSADFREIAESHVETGCLHGARRCNEDGTPIHEGEMAGYFHLFHATDPNAQVRPIVDTHWTHAGCYDSYFARRWPREDQIFLPMTVVHQGEMGRNWCGVGNDEAMDELMYQRFVHKGHQHERIE